MDYILKKTRRRSIAIEVNRQGTVIVRAPYNLSDEKIDTFVKQKEKWIERQKETVKLLKEHDKELGITPPSPEELKELADKAIKVIPERVRYYAEKMGVTYGKITIRNQRTRWGSCSSKGNLSFNCLLMLMPPEAIDCVVVHELAHRKEMNHSAKFYAEILNIFPEYYRWNNWIKLFGRRIMMYMD